MMMENDGEMKGEMKSAFFMARQAGSEVAPFTEMKADFI